MPEVTKSQTFPSLMEGSEKCFLRSVGGWRAELNAAQCRYAGTAWYCF